MRLRHGPPLPLHSQLALPVLMPTSLLYKVRSFSQARVYLASQVTSGFPDSTLCPIPMPSWGVRSSCGVKSSCRRPPSGSSLYIPFQSPQRACQAPSAPLLSSGGGGCSPTLPGTRSPASGGICSHHSHHHHPRGLGPPSGKACLVAASQVPFFSHKSQAT